MHQMIIKYSTLIAPMEMLDVNQQQSIARPVQIAILIAHQDMDALK